MENIMKFINDNSSLLVLGLAAMVLILFIVVMVLIGSVSKVKKRYRKLMRGSKAGNLEALINEKLSDIEESMRNSEQALEKCDLISNEMRKCVNKVSVMRYKAFENVGSDLSFSIAILDDYDNGVVVTGIYSRNDSTTYAKPIEKGMSKYDLSEEEKQVLNEAMAK